MTDEDLKALVADLVLSTRELREGYKESREGYKELREGYKELRESQKETDKQIKRVSQQIGDIGNRLGEFVVEMIKPNALDLFNQRGIAVEEVHTGIEIHRPHYQSDIDLMLVNGRELVAIEVKSAFKMGHIYRHLERLKHIREAMPAYANYTIYGGIGSMVMPDEVKELGIEEGLFVILPKGENLTLANSEDFQPRAW